MDFTAESILERMTAALKNEDTKIEGSFSMDNLQAVAEEIARFDAVRLRTLTNMLADKEDDMGTSGNERHYVRWAKAAKDPSGKTIVGNAKVDAPRDGTGFVSIAIITTEAKPPTEDQIRIVQEYIDSMRPVGASPTVKAVEGEPVTILCDILMENGYTAETLKRTVRSDLEAYFLQIAFQSGTATLNYYKVSNIISGVDGVSAVENLRINGLQESITADYDKYFTLEELVINVTE